MIPSVRSRFLAALTAFVLGFGIANLGLFLVPRPDQWLFVAVAATLMFTSVWGVLVSDSRRPISVWAVVGVEVFAVFSLVPLLWLFTLATSGGETIPTALWPESLDWGGFERAWDAEGLRRAAGTSLITGLVSTVLAVPLALGIAVTLVRVRLPGARIVRTVVLAVLLAPLAALAVAIDDLAVDLAGADTRWAVAIAQLLVTLPLATWLFVVVLEHAPWNLVQAARVEGASPALVLRRVLVPTLGPGLAVGTLLVLVVACQDLVLGAALSATTDSRTLSAALLALPDDPESASIAAAAGLLWMLPVLLGLLVVPRAITRLLGRAIR